MSNILTSIAKVIKKECLDMKINEYKGCYALYARFSIEKFNLISLLIWRHLMKRMEMGEVISIQVTKGEFRDMGIKTININGGEIWEFYDYEDLSHYYIRLIIMEKNRERWIALYIDHNPISPWWGHKERGEA